MQTVELFDGVRDHAFTITDLTTSDNGFDVAVTPEAGRHAHRFFVRRDDDGFFRVSAASNPDVRIQLVDNQYAETLRVTVAESGDEDVSGHAAPPVLELTGTVSDDDDVSAHISAAEGASTVLLAAASAYMLLQLSGEGFYDEAEATTTDGSTNHD